MKFSIRKANIKSPKTIALINRLQKETLPYDKRTNQSKESGLLPTLRMASQQLMRE